MQGHCRVLFMLNILSLQRVTAWKRAYGTGLQEHSTPVWWEGKVGEDSNATSTFLRPDSSAEASS